MATKTTILIEDDRDVLLRSAVRKWVNDALDNITTTFDVALAVVVESLRKEGK